MSNLINLATSGLNQFVATTKAVSNIVANVKGLMAGVASLPSTMSSLVSGALTSGYNGYSTAGNMLSAAEAQDQGIYEFISHFKKGVMKSNRFRAEFSLPSGVKRDAESYSVNINAMNGAIKLAEMGFNSTSSIDIKCHTVSFPTRSLQTLAFRCNSVEFKVPYTASYDALSLIFYADGNMDTREYFELWQSSIINFGNNTANFYKEYVSDIKLYVQNESGADTYGVVLFECYPMQISAFDMSYSTSSTPLSIQILFSFKSWLPLSNSNINSFNRTF